MKEMRALQIEWVIIVVACCVETLSVDAWSYGCGEDLAPDLYRQRIVHLGKPELVRWPWPWLPERRQSWFYNVDVPELPHRLELHGKESMIGLRIWLNLGQRDDC